MSQPKSHIDAVNTTTPALLQLQHVQFQESFLDYVRILGGVFVSNGLVLLIMYVVPDNKSVQVLAIFTVGMFFFFLYAALSVFWKAKIIHATQRYEQQFSRQITASSSSSAPSESSPLQSKQLLLKLPAFASQNHTSRG